LGCLISRECMIGALVGVFSGDIGKHWGNMYISTVFVFFVYSRGGGPIARKILGEGRSRVGSCCGIRS
jgi:hypothetical protein